MYTILCLGIVIWETGTQTYMPLVIIARYQYDIYM